MPLQSPFGNRSFLSARSRFIKSAPAKTVPQGMAIYFSPGIKPFVYETRYSVSAMIQNRIKIGSNYYIDLYEKLQKELFDNILSQKPNSKSTFYIRTDLTFDTYQDPVAYADTIRMYMIGAWDRNGLLRKPHMKIVGGKFRKKFIGNSASIPISNGIRKLPEDITVTSHNAMMWKKNGRLSRKALMAEDTNNHSHACYLSRYKLRKYYYQITPYGLI